MNLPPRLETTTDVHAMAPASVAQRNSKSLRRGTQYFSCNREGFYTSQTVPDSGFGRPGLSHSDAHRNYGQHFVLHICHTCDSIVSTRYSASFGLR